MTWFRVDDGFHSHPKVLPTSLEARGLWVTAGSWASSHLTDGFVPLAAIASLGGSPTLADELVTAGLWKRRKCGKVTGYQFHQWSPRNPTRKAVENEREKWRESKRRSRDGILSTVDNAGTPRGSPAIPVPIPKNGSVAVTADRQRARPSKPGMGDSMNGAASRHPSSIPFRQAQHRALHPEEP